MEELDIKQIFILLKHHIWKIIIISILLGIFGYMISSYVLTEKYESSAIMYISSNKNSSVYEELTYSEYNLNIKLVNSYSELCKTNRILSKVLEETDLDISLKALSNMISVNSLNDTEIIQIVVKNTDPEVATIVANAVAEVFTREIPDIIKMDNVQIIDYATMPNKPVEPNIMRNTLIAIFCGMFLSVLVIFVIEYLDVSIKERKQLEEILDMPVFGVIPRANFNDSINKSKKNGVSSFVIKEAFVRLASNIGFLNVDNTKSICIAVTSSIKGEGKSTIVSNLAIALAQSNKKVLLLDADMRRPIVHKLFRLTNRSGLSSALSSDEPWKKYVLTTQFEKLDVIVAGMQPPNPTMLLSTHKMMQMVEETKELYDYILIDTPPILMVPDVLGLCSNVDHILLVARYKRTTISDINRVKEDFAQIKAPLTGAILNDYASESGNDSYANYGYSEITHEEPNKSHEKISNKSKSSSSNKRRAHGS